MLKRALEYLNDLAKPTTIVVDGRKFYDNTYSPAEEIYPATMKIYSLTGIMDYLEEEPEEWGYMFIHVVDFDHVVLYQSMTGPFNQREPIIISTSRPCMFRFGQKMSVESFIVSMRSLFVNNADREYLLKFLSGVRVDVSAKVEDDGVSQKVTARQGTSSLMSELVLKPVVTLQPFRTFNEISQPESEFIFRLSMDENKMPMVALHECYGGAWKQRVIVDIKAWFKSKGVTIPVIA